jgi:acetolactate synthase-1/2/3 large subunit
MQYGLDLTVMIVNNGMYGTIRMHQERDYPDRIVGTSLVNPDFADFARAFGAHGEAVARTEEFEPAFVRALAHPGPSVIELRVDPDTLGPKVTLSGVKGTGAKR